MAKVVITGATGMVGRGVLIECLEDERISEVLMVNRHSLNFEDPKLKELILPDFFELSGLENHLKGYDACFFCLGVSSIGMKEKEYSKLTYELTVNFAKKMYLANPNSQFIYVSGTGTDSSEKGRSMWARVKGRTENAIFNMGFKAAYAFRPGYIQPMKGVKSKTNWYSAVYIVLSPFYFLFKGLKGAVTSTENVGKAMNNAVLHSHETKVFNNREINAFARMNV